MREGPARPPGQQPTLFATGGRLILGPGDAGAARPGVGIFRKKYGNFGITRYWLMC